MKFHAIVSFLLLLCAVVNKSNAQTPAESLDAWSLKAPIEKTYLHFDRDNYIAGETAWFKSYFLSEFLPDTISTNLFVEVADAEARLVTRKVYPIVYASAMGQLELPDTLPTGYYSIRAYTQTMLNNDAAFVFQKRVFVYGKTTTAAPPQSKRITMQFFPEAGQLVQGEANRVAFKITNEYGEAINTSGSIINDKGDTVTTFSTYHDGMGVFNLLPEPATKYTAVVAVAYQKFELPVATAAGLLFKVHNKTQGISYEVLQPAGSVKAAYVVGQMQHKIAFSQAIKEGTQRTSGLIDAKGLPSGILQLTLFSKEHLPLAERLVFVDNKEYILPAQLVTEISSLSPRGLNKLNLSFADSISGTFSVAVTDPAYDISESREGDIVSSFLLISDLKGYIHNPGWYFTTTADSATAGRDLLMMINGWSRFKWTELAAKLKAPLQHKDAGYITVSGKVNVRDTKRAVPDKQILFLLKSLEDTLSSGSMQLVETNSNGEFRLDSLLFFGKTSFVASDISEKQKKWLDAKPYIDSIAFTGLSPVFNNSVLKHSYSSGFSNTLQAKFKNDFDAIQAAEGTMLEEVAIVAKKKSPQQALEERYVSGLFSSGNTTAVLDLVNTEEKIFQANILDYIQGRIAGVNVSRSTGGYTLNYRNARSLMGGPIPMILFLNETVVDASILATIPANDVAMVKVMPSFVGAEGNAPGGVLAVYTKKGSDALSSNTDKATGSFAYKGYSIIKEFYAPDYKQNPEGIKGGDNRITLHWQPSIVVTGGEKNVPIEFYNNDRSKQYRVIAEGITTDGRLLRIERLVSPKGF